MEVSKLIPLVLLASLLVAEVSAIDVRNILSKRLCRFRCRRRRNQCATDCFKSKLIVCEGQRTACLENCVMLEVVCMERC
ncbi:hypothetical protein NP493_6299g00000 [Ridgeia piscesae]|uniref:Uncharacterized protein n=1 Tax=Ridgeia piscesae TaxID=27915 RepID=A0AAD9IRE8_RIDPI|nr:hypothetical protein NP493_6299g00000 [Ridgeia piscesae]